MAYLEFGCKQENPDEKELIHLMTKSNAIKMQFTGLLIDWKIIKKKKFCISHLAQKKCLALFETPILMF